MSKFARGIGKGSFTQHEFITELVPRKVAGRFWKRTFPVSR